MKTFLKTKRALLISTGILVGFAAGSWTPLGELGSLGNLTNLALKSDHFSALVGSSVPSDKASRQGRTNFEPWISRVRDLHETSLSVKNRNAMIDILSQAMVPQGAQSTAGQSGLAASLDQQGLKIGSLGQNAIFADSPNAEIRIVIGAVEAENQQIAAYLQSQSPETPEYHLTRSVYQSNNQWLQVLRFMMQKNDGAISVGSIAGMTPVLEGLRQKVEESTYLGRQLVLRTMNELIALETGNPQDEAFKGLLLSFTESYDTSYEIEEVLASLVTDYPQLVAQSLSGHNMSNEIANWDLQTLQLVNERMQLKNYRQDMAMSLSAGPVS